MNILIIDDEPYLLEKLVSVLTSEHYTVETAADGNAGLEKIWNDTYDVILLDIMLPGKNGLEILSEIRAAWLPSGQQSRTISRVVPLRSGTTRALGLGERVELDIELTFLAMPFR